MKSVKYQVSDQLRNPVFYQIRDQVSGQIMNQITVRVHTPVQVHILRLEPK